MYITYTHTHTHTHTHSVQTEAFKLRHSYIWKERHILEKCILNKSCILWCERRQIMIRSICEKIDFLRLHEGCCHFLM